MGRVINTNSPGKRRGHLRRTIAEMIRRLSQKQGIDDDAKDMLATIIISLRAIDKTIEESIVAWEKKGYWKKADDFQNKWYWVIPLAEKVEQLLRSEDWDKIPEIMIKLLPHFSDIEINKFMRKEDDWQGNYHQLIKQSD